MTSRFAKLLKPEITNHGFLLEGPIILNPESGEFAVVDIYNAKVFDDTTVAREDCSAIFLGNLNDETLKKISIEDRLFTPAAILPTTEEDYHLLVSNQGLFTLNKNTEEIAHYYTPKFIEDWPEGTRPNDSRLTPDGDLMISWMGEAEFRESGKKPGQLWLIKAEDKSEHLLADNLCIPNGFCFKKNAEGYIVYYNDTPNGSTDIYDFLPNENPPKFIKQDSPLIHYGDSDDNNPDGMTMTADGKYLIVPHFNLGGLKVVNTESGEVENIIKIPNAPQTTAVDILPSGKMVITTASEGYLDEDFKKDGQENSGSLFVFDGAEYGLFGPKEIPRFQL